MRFGHTSVTCGQFWALIWLDIGPKLNKYLRRNDYDKRNLAEHSTILVSERERESFEDASEKNWYFLLERDITLVFA